MTPINCSWVKTLNTSMQLSAFFPYIPQVYPVQWDMNGQKIYQKGTIGEKPKPKPVFKVEDFDAKGEE